MDSNAVILLYEGALVAVLVQLSDAIHGRRQGRWTIEATFGVTDVRTSETFSSISDAAKEVSDAMCESPMEFEPTMRWLN
ncbi:MAG: hypothetical protein NVS3B5_15300 [Sphingomicrobium sp.]